MTLELLTRKELRQVYDSELRGAFPDTERKPFFAMDRLLRQGRYHPFAAVEGGHTVGYALMWVDGAAGVALMDYFWVTAARRGTGVGTRILGLLPAQYADYKGILVEAEHPDGQPEEGRAAAVRRLEFYRRAGYEALEYDCGLFGVWYKALWYPIAGAEPQAVMDAHRGLYLGRHGAAMMRRYVQIPLTPGATIPRVPW